jgi:Holliday junction DNA helicase RuvA
MFGYLEGKLVGLSPAHTYLEVNGLGDDVQITLNTYESIQGKETCRLFTHLQVREDAWTLYGFATEKEREAFQRLLSISGVGAATARILLSSLRPEDLAGIVFAGDSKALEKVKGIGAKTAQRIILELKGKLPLGAEAELNGLTHNTTEQDALNALTGLGIGKAMAQAALNKTRTSAGNESVEEWIKEALKCL